VKDAGVEGRIILKWMFEVWDGNMNWINLVQDRDSWRVFVDVVMSTFSLLFPATD
jgi:hypothetical protein